ncbi:MAG: MFS transporter [Bacteroidales bacterium]|nr:MFS transporter [Bacteroidales bacterium]
MSEKSIYHRAKIWQIGLFALNNTAVNLYAMMIIFIAYFAGGVLGLTVALVSTLIMAMRLFDGITDPIIGWFIDRTNGKFGKFRPFMMLGNAVMAGSLALMYISQYMEGAKIPFFIFAYFIYVIGYSFQFCVTRAAQPALTNDPKQRPVFSAFDMVMNVILFVGVSLLVSNYLVVKHGDFTGSMFGEFFVIIAVASAICTAFAIIGIWKKDRTEFFGLAEKASKIRLRDGWNALRHNRAVQMLMISAGTDRLFSNITTNAVVSVIIFGIICGDFALHGQFNLFVFGPTILISLLCIQYARKLGQKEAFLFATYGGIIFSTLIFFLFLLGDPTTLSFTYWGPFTILFLVFMAFRGGFMSVNNSIVVPMIADVADSEVARSGKYLPGMIGALFTTVDKLILSLNTVIIGALLIFVAGYRDAFPSVHTPFTEQLFWVGMIAYCFLPILGWIINIICMRFYPLNREKMAKTQQIIQDIKTKSPLQTS